MLMLVLVLALRLAPCNLFSNGLGLLVLSGFNTGWSDGDDGGVMAMTFTAVGDRGDNGGDSAAFAALVDIPIVGVVRPLSRDGEGGVLVVSPDDMGEDVVLEDRTCCLYLPLFLSFFNSFWR